jgi:transcriptional regulator with XRE-family HTH domain
MARSHHSIEFETLRLKTGLSLAETADLLGITEGAVIRYENGDSRPSPIAIKWLQEHLAILPTGLVRVGIRGGQMDWSDGDNGRESATDRSVAASSATSRKAAVAYCDRCIQLSPIYILHAPKSVLVAKYNAGRLSFLSAPE